MRAKKGKNDVENRKNGPKNIFIHVSHLYTFPRKIPRPGTKVPRPGKKVPRLGTFFSRLTKLFTKLRELFRKLRRLFRKFWRLLTKFWRLQNLGSRYLSAKSNGAEYFLQSISKSRYFFVFLPTISKHEKLLF